VQVSDLRSIGKCLFREIGAVRLTQATAIALEKGAGGDRTFAVDKQAEDLILGAFERLGEPMSIVSEEYGLKEIRGGGQHIVVDPIDGSKNAISGLPLYCASIAVADGETVGALRLGYVINLLTGDEFWAEKGAGAFFNGVRMQTQQDSIVGAIAFEAQVPHRDLPRLLPLLNTARRVRCLGAVALDLCHVAYSSLSVFCIAAPSRAIDFSAGVLIVREAGGIVTDIEGRPIDEVALDLKRSVSLLAAGNMTLHDRALSVVSSGAGA